MAGYFTKLDSGITESTIWQAPDTTRIVWITMMAMADQHGYVGASLPGLASRARVSMQACAEAVKAFLAPDEYSRTADFEGRRIAEADGGWILLNHAKYRAKISAEDKRERSRVAMAALRARRKAEANSDAVLTPVTCGDHALTLLSQAEADNRSREEITPPLRGSPPADAGQTARGTRIPDNWEPGSDGREFALAVGISGSGFQSEASKFCDYWRSQPGVKGRKSDWQATWRNWCRRASESRPATASRSAMADVFETAK